MSKSLLILDIDETLVFATETPLNRACDFRVGPLHVYRRPFLNEFLAAVAEWFDVAVWSTGSANYVQGVVDHIFDGIAPPAFVWSRDRCTRRYDPELQQSYFTKNLSKLRRKGFALERVLMIDDSPEKLAQHYGNHIKLAPFMGDQSDCELQHLLPFLETLRRTDNVRGIEKRGWRTHGKKPKA